MSRVTRNQKVFRAVQFLLALRHPKAQQALTRYGFGQLHLAEGQELVRMATDPQLSFSQPSTPDPGLIGRLDEFENRWFPIVKLVLSRHFPEVHEWVYRNLSQTTGPDLIVSTDTFLRRLRALQSGTSEMGERGKDAFALLVQRGLDEDTLRQAEELIASVSSFVKSDAKGFDEEAHAEAVDELWKWYLEWSGIARLVIDDRRVLRNMGFLKPRSVADVNEDVSDDEEADTVDDVAAVTQSPATATEVAS